MSRTVAVVGAGVVGLAAASALRRAGLQVRLFEKAEPGQAQSVGLTRIFRHAHGDPALVQLAMRAREAWRVWEQRSGRRLVGADGLIVTAGAVAQRWERAMREAGAPCAWLTADQARARLPISRPPDGPALWDPAAGSIRARRTIDLLRADLAGCLVPAEVLELMPTGTGLSVRTAAEHWECDQVVVAAGVDTPRLAAQVGLSLPAALVRASRFTFARRGRRADLPLACWIDDSEAYGPGLSAYGQPVGSTGRYAIGVTPDGAGYPAALDATEVSARSRVVTQRYVQQAFPGLDPEPLAEVQCLHATTGTADGDGFGAARCGAATVVFGHNLFKFAPLLGELLCRAVVEEEIPAELRAGELRVR